MEEKGSIYEDFSQYETPQVVQKSLADVQSRLATLEKTAANCQRQQVLLEMEEESFKTLKVSGWGVYCYDFLLLLASPARV